MAAADYFSTFKPCPVPNCMRVKPGLPGLLPPKRPDKRKIHSVWPARPSPGADSNSTLTSPPKSHPREGPWPPTHAVGAAISHRAAPILPTPPGEVSPLVPPHEVWVGRGRRRPNSHLRVPGRRATFWGPNPPLFPPPSWESWSVRSLTVLVFVRFWPAGADHRLEPCRLVVIAL